MNALSDAVHSSIRLPSVRSMLAWIVVACLLPATIGIEALVCYLDRDGHAQLYKETLHSTRALTLLIDDELDLAKTAAEMLTTASDLHRTNWPGLHARAKMLLETRNGGRNAIFSHVNGQQIVNTSVPFGAALPMFGDLGHLRRIVASGEPAI